MGRSCMPLLACSRSSADRASVFGTECRGFKSLRERLSHNVRTSQGFRAGAPSFFTSMAASFVIILPAPESEGRIQ